MAREGGNKEKMRKCREWIPLYILILSPFPHFLPISSFSLHFLFISSFSLHFLASRMQGCSKLCNPVCFSCTKYASTLQKFKYWSAHCWWCNYLSWLVTSFLVVIKIKLMIIVSSLQDHQNDNYRPCQKQIDDHLLVTLVTASSVAHGVSCMLRQQIEHLTSSRW